MAPTIELLAAGVAAVVVLTAVVVLFRRARRSSAAATRLRTMYADAGAHAGVDSLTGIGNARAFEEALERQAAEFLSDGLPFALAIIDVDDLAVVNASEGQTAGDELLSGVAETMQQLARPEDRPYRIGGDEFAMILPGIGAAPALTMLERILHFSRLPPAGIRPCSFSAGISALPEFSTDPEPLRRQAQAALEWVKGHGRGATSVYDPDRDRVPDQHHDKASRAVRDVVSGGLLSPVFQPIVDLDSGRVLGFEGLIRPDPQSPLPDPAHLFAAASASGRTVEVDLACADVVLAGARGIAADHLLTLNLSPRTLEINGFDAAWLLDGLMRNGISPSRVIIELTERDAVTDLGQLRRTFSHLRLYGMRVAADDVGAGSAGVSLFSKLPFDILKIDLGLVQNGAHDEAARATLESLRDLAIGQDASVVAEGVETAEQLRVVRDLRISAGQGFLLGRPAPGAATTFVDVGRLADGRPPVSAGIDAGSMGRAPVWRPPSPTPGEPTPKPLMAVPVVTQRGPFALHPPVPANGNGHARAAGNGHGPTNGHAPAATNDHGPTNVHGYAMPSGDGAAQPALRVPTAR